MAARSLRNPLFLLLFCTIIFAAEGYTSQTIFKREGRFQNQRHTLRDSYSMAGKIATEYIVSEDVVVGGETEEVGIKMPEIKKSIHEEFNSLTLTTFNLLAPCYKRIRKESLNSDQQKLKNKQFPNSLPEMNVPRESEFSPLWKSRVINTLDFIEKDLVTSDIICLQEYWFEPVYQKLFHERFGSDFEFLTKKRPGEKTDGLAILVRKDSLKHMGSQGIPLSSMGDRVGLLSHLKYGRKAQHSLLLANCHLTFPHNQLDQKLQLNQIKSITYQMELFASQENVPLDTPRIIVGDFNVEDSDQVCDHLRSIGYKSAFRSFHSPQKHVVTHKNHKGEQLMVDHIWICNPQKKDIKNLSIHDNFAERPELSVRDASLFPKGIDDCVWNSNFSISDHRPVQVKLGLSLKESTL